jgi:hypothetical protein
VEDSGNADESEDKEETEDVTKRLAEVKV